MDLKVPKTSWVSSLRNFNPVDHEIQCEMISPSGQPSSFWLVSRSSISKSPLMLANSIGLIDAGYRGNIIAAFKYFKQPRDCDGVMYEIAQGSKVVQICSPLLTPIRVVVVDELSSTSRGSGGFGSTSSDSTSSTSSSSSSTASTSTSTSTSSTSTSTTSTSSTSVLGSLMCLGRPDVSKDD